MRFSILVPVMLGLLLDAGGAQAQELELGGGIGSVDHDLLGSPAFASAAVTVGVAPSLGFRLGYRRGHDGFTTTGTTCSGLIFSPLECGEERRRETATLRSWSLGMVLSQEFGTLEMRLLPALRRMSMESTQKGTESGRVRAAEKTVYGAEVGLEAHFAFVDDSPLRLYAGIFGATHPWFGEVIVADGYTPFEETVDMVWVEAGVTLVLFR